MTAKAKDIYTTVDELVATMGTAASNREKIEREISDLETELAALDTMLDDASDRAEYDEISTAREACQLDLKFARNRLRRFNVSPRIDSETISDLMSQLSAEADGAAKRFRQKVDKPLAEIVTAGDEFDADINAIRRAVRKLASIEGSVIETDHTLQRLFWRFELGTLRSRAYKDNDRIVHPGFRDALALAGTAKQPVFDTY